MVWNSCGTTLSDRVERVQNYALRIILRKPPRTRSEGLCQTLLDNFPTPVDSQATAPAPTVPSPIVPVPTAENVDETDRIVPTCKSTVNNVVNETEYTAVSDSALEEHHTSQSESFLSVTQIAQLNT